MRVCAWIELFMKKGSDGTQGEHDLRTTSANWTAQAQREG